MHYHSPYIIRTKNNLVKRKSNVVHNIWQWFHSGHQELSPMAIQPMLTTNKSNVQSLDFILWQFMSFKRFNEKTITLEILSGLAQIVVNEQCLIFFPLGQSSTCKIHMFQILKTILCSCNELAQCFRALFMSPNEKKLIHKYLWHQQSKNLHNIF